MKKVRTTTILAITFISLTAISCKDSKKEQKNTQDNYSEMNYDKMSTSNEMMDSDAKNSDSKQALIDYMVLKDALVATDEDAAAKAGEKLQNTLKSFKVDSYTSEQQKELKDIIEDALEHAEHIGKSAIDHQREHFKILSKDVMDMVVITGTENTIYQQFCPMYDGGSAWLSKSKDIKNPYYGSKMSTCGKVQKVIN